MSDLYDLTSFSEEKKENYRREDEEEKARVVPGVDFFIFDPSGIEMNGFISPEGILYKCRYGMHEYLAQSRGFSDSYGPERLGWVKLQDAEFFQRELERFAHVNECNQAQLNAMVKWCERHGADADRLVHKVFKVKE